MNGLRARGSTGRHQGGLREAERPDPFFCGNPSFGSRSCRRRIEFAFFQISWRVTSFFRSASLLT